MPSRLDHLQLICRDLDKTANFYKEIFGACEIERLIAGDAPTVRLDLDGTKIVLKGIRPVDKEIYTKFGFSHYGIEVNDLDEMFQNIKGRGVKFIEEPKVVRPGLKIAFLEGPSGELIELIENKPASQL